MGGQEDLDKSLKAIMAAKRDELGEPPTPEELLAYRDGRLDPAERQRMDARLAVYPDAARTLVDLAAFPDVEPAPGTPVLSEEEIGGRWRAFRQRLPERASPPEKPPLPQALTPLPLSPRGREGKEKTEKASGGAFPLRLAAAALVGVAVGSVAGFFGASKEAPESAINVEIEELAPKEDGGSRAAETVLEMPEGSEELVLVLSTQAQEDFSDYEVEILDSQGARIWWRQGLRPTELGTFQVSFRQGVLKPGRLRVRLFGREGEVRRLVGTYEVNLVPPP